MVKGAASSNQPGSRTGRSKAMHYTQQINKLWTAIELISPYAYEGNEVMRAIDNITDVQEDIWGRYKPIYPDRPLETFRRFKRNLARRRAITVAMIKEQSND